jgi:hypothetical protein
MLHARRDACGLKKIASVEKPASEVNNARNHFIRFSSLMQF